MDDKSKVERINMTESAFHKQIQQYKVQVELLE